jgi:hypothetical protein
MINIKKNRIFLTLESYKDDESHTIKQHIFKPINKEDFYLDRKWVGNKSLCGHITVGDDDEKNAEFKTLLDRNEQIDNDNICLSCMKIYLKEQWNDLENSKLDIPLKKWD